MKRQILEENIQQMKQDAKQNNSHNLFKMVGNLERYTEKPIRTINDQNANIIC